MSHQRITPCRIAAFASHLRALERSPATIDCYLRHLRAFAQWLDGRAVSRTAVQDWKTHLADSGAAPSTVNSKLAALHSFFAFQGWQDLRVSYLRVQRRLFRDPARELTRRDYERLRTVASRESPAARLLLETLAATGIRASELSHITVQAVRNGRADIRLKGKIRTILLVPSLCRKLRAFAKKQKIVHGAIFCTKDDAPIPVIRSGPCSSALLFVPPSILTASFPTICAVFSPSPTMRRPATSCASPTSSDIHPSRPPGAISPPAAANTSASSTASISSPETESSFCCIERQILHHALCPHTPITQK